MPETYTAPLDQLLKLGDAWKMKKWPDYLAMGFGPEHIPDLIRMALDPALNEFATESSEVWGPAHAWRTLAQLHAAEAAAPLATLLQRIDDDHDDFVTEDLPVAFGILGPAALPVLAEYVSDTDHGVYARCAAAAGLSEIGERHSETRQAAAEALARPLARSDDWDRDLNGFIVADLLKLQAAEQSPAMEAAFAGKRVATGIAGDWEDVQIELGLKTEREHPREPDTDMDDVDQVLTKLEQLRAMQAGKAVAPAQTEKQMPYRKPTPEPASAPSGKHRKHHKRK